MSDTIHIELGGARQAGIRFETFPDALYQDLRAEIEALTDEAFAIEQARLPSLTGKLRTQFRSHVHADKDRISGVVYFDGKGSGKGSDFAKAGALEYGSTGKPFKISAHSMRLDHLWSQKLARPINVLVAAFSRPGRIAEHAFVRGTISAMRGQVRDRLQAVLATAVDRAEA